ncbi:MAG: SH3 domain-containing protein [Thermodesulfobacteriota bacterium]
MSHRKPLAVSMILYILILFFAMGLGWTPAVLAASYRLPNVSREMENPDFWTKKIQDPGRLLLTLDQIRKMNEESLKAEGLYLCRLKDLKEEWTKEEILTLLDEDWQGFGRTDEIRYGRYGSPHEDSFWSELIRNLNRESLGEKSRMLFGLIAKRTDIRVFPTDEISMVSSTSYEFDRFQHSSISPGSLIGIYHFSRDRLWAYVQTGFIRGWVRTTAVAIAKDKKEAIDYEEAKERLLMRGSFVKIFGEPSLRQVVFAAQMGNTFPMLNQPHTGTGREQPSSTRARYILQIPFREADGTLTFRKGYVSKDEDVHRGFLPYTQENLANQAFKMLHQPYGWGEMFGARDCSRFIMDIFAAFGILMPRNSKLQARIGIPLGQVEGMPLKEKERVLDRAIPLATTLRLPGHIMLYLGKDKENYYAIHNLWAIQKRGWFGPVLQKIGKVVVSDLSLGRDGPSQSLLHRVTDIQVIASDLEVRK